jgi:glycosyltransferase involved in cell wall biosynthesis
MVHITSCLTLSASVVSVAKDFGLPVVLTLTDFWFVCHSLSLLKYDGSICDGLSNTQGCLQCLSWNSGAYQKIKRFTSERVATQIFDILSKLSFINRQRGLRGYALNVAQRRSYLTAMLKVADIITAPSNHLREMLRRSGVKDDILVIHSGHDLSWLKTYHRQISNNVVRFGYLGQFIPTKGVQVLLAAFTGLDWQGKAELHLYGNMDADPIFWQELQNINSHNAQNVHFHGAFPHEKLGEMLSGLDVLIVPSLWHENNPRVIQEAFACKIPVIASDVGGISEFVQHEVNGLLFERGNVNDLQKQLRCVVREPRLLERLQSGIPFVKLIEDEVSEFEAIYKTLIPSADFSCAQ